MSLSTLLTVLQSPAMLLRRLRSHVPLIVTYIAISRSRVSIISADLSLGKVAVARLKSRRFFRYLGLLTQGKLDVGEPRLVIGGAVVITVGPDSL